LVLRAREITRGLEPSFLVPGVLKSFKDDRVLAEVRDVVLAEARDVVLSEVQGGSDTCKGRGRVYHHHI
jgi:hypothetical protein